MSLQKNQATILLHEVIGGLGKKVVLRSRSRIARQERNNASKANGDPVANGNSKETHWMLIGLQ